MNDVIIDGNCSLINKIVNVGNHSSVNDAFNNIFIIVVQVNSFVGAFHDAVILYALALNETLAAGYNASNGTDITHRMWNRTFKGA